MQYNCGMSTLRFTLPAAVFLILRRDNKVLLLKRYNTGWHDGEYDLIAGHLEAEESLTTALVRESRDEIGITVQPQDVQFESLLHGHFDNGKEYFYVFFQVTRWKGTPKIMEPEKCSELSWFDIAQLPANLTPGTQLGLNAYLYKQPYKEFGFPQSF